MEFFKVLVSNGALALLLALFVADTIIKLSAKGTRLRHVSASIIATFTFPCFALYVLGLLIAVVDQDWFGVLLHIYLLWSIARLWNRNKDEDNWWTGRGKKIGTAIKKAFTVSSPAAAGAGA